MKALTHNGIHFEQEYPIQINIEPVPKSYFGAKLVWIVAHDRSYDRKWAYFFTKQDAIDFANSDKYQPHEWGGDIHIYWMARGNAVLNDKGEIIDVRNK
jgi:hypothetical protein